VRKQTNTFLAGKIVSRLRRKHRRRWQKPAAGKKLTIDRNNAGAAFVRKARRHQSLSNQVFPRKTIMTIRTRFTLGISAAVLSVGLALAPPALAQDKMGKDDMKKDTMSKDGMKKDSMSKDNMSKDSMSKDSMSKDSMSKGGMKKDDNMMKKN
jgi:pentapeptide MXKDX repeat protein